MELPPMKVSLSKLGPVLTFFLLCLIAVLWYLTHRDSPPTSQSVVQNGTNNTQNAALVSGSQNNTISANTVTNNGQIVQGGNIINNYYSTQMKSLDEQRRDDLKKIFPLGYVLVTGTTRDGWIPGESPLDTLFNIDWAAGFKVSMEPDQIYIRLGKFYFSAPGLNWGWEAVSNTIGIWPNLNQLQNIATLSQQGHPEKTVFIKADVLETNANAAIFAIGATR